MNDILNKGSELLNKGKEWGKEVLPQNIGKDTLKKGGIIGVGLGVVAGAGYLVYNYYDKRMKEAAAKEEERRAELRRIDNIDDNHPGINGDKKIVI